MDRSVSIIDSINWIIGTLNLLLVNILTRTKTRVSAGLNILTVTSAILHLADAPKLRNFQGLTQEANLSI